MKVLYDLYLRVPIPSLWSGLNTLRVAGVGAPGHSIPALVAHRRLLLAACRNCVPARSRASVPLSCCVFCFCFSLFFSLSLSLSLFSAVCLCGPVILCLCVCICL